jgi:hypothetical protein
MVLKFKGLAEFARDPVQNAFEAIEFREGTRRDVPHPVSRHARQRGARTKLQQDGAASFAQTSRHAAQSIITASWAARTYEANGKGDRRLLGGLRPSPVQVVLTLSRLTLNLPDTSMSGSKRAFGSKRGSGTRRVGGIALSHRSMLAQKSMKARTFAGGL